MTFVVVFEVGPKLHRLGEKIVSKLDELKSVNQVADLAIARVQEDVTFLKTKVGELETKLGQGDTFTAEEEAELASLKEKLARLDPVPDNGTPPPA